MILILQARRANFSRLQNKMDQVQQIHKGWRVGAGENRASPFIIDGLNLCRKEIKRKYSPKARGEGAWVGAPRF